MEEKHTQINLDCPVWAPLPTKIETQLSTTTRTVEHNTFCVFVMNKKTKCNDFSIIFGKHRDDVGMSLGTFWDDFFMILGWFGNSLGMIWGRFGMV
jgi:hypothetical protein